MHKRYFANLGVVFNRQKPLFGIKKALLRLTHLEARKVSEHVTLLGNFVVLACCDYIVFLKGKQLEVVPVCLPKVSQVGLKSEFKLVALLPGILDFNPCIALFTATVAVPKIESYCNAGTAAPIASAEIAVRVILVISEVISCIQLNIRIVARNHLLVVELRQTAVLLGKQKVGIACQS